MKGKKKQNWPNLQIPHFYQLDPQIDKNALRHTHYTHNTLFIICLFIYLFMWRKVQFKDTI
jgi:hypothetical protein